MNQTTLALVLSAYSSALKTWESPDPLHVRFDLPAGSFWYQFVDGQWMTVRTPTGHPEAAAIERVILELDPTTSTLHSYVVTFTSRLATDVSIDVPLDTHLTDDNEIGRLAFDRLRVALGLRLADDASSIFTILNIEQVGE